MLLSVLIRDMKKAELAVQKMRTVANSTQRIELFHLDLANLETVDQVCSKLQEKIYYLINIQMLLLGSPKIHTVWKSSLARSFSQTVYPKTIK